MQFLLIGILCLASLALLLLGLAQWRRGRHLAGAANELGLAFSVDDPFDLPRRYAGFRLMQAGHSPFADNVIFGRYRGWPLRSFDYRLEAGHGTQRHVRRYSVLSAEVAETFPAVMLWPQDSACPDPRRAEEAVPVPNGWYASGDAATARRVGQCMPPADASGMSIEIDRGLLLFCIPRRLGGSELAATLEIVSNCLKGLQASA
jgi:hypothetical protein